MLDRYPDHLDRLGREVSRALQAAGFDALVVHSGTALRQRRSDDQFWPVKPTPAFAHWLPLVEEGSALVLEPGARPRLLRAAADDFWDSPVAEPAEHLAHFEVAHLPPERLADELPRGRVAFVGDDAEAAARWGLEHANPPALIEALDAVRAIKSDYERACIAEANRRAAAGHRAVALAFAAGETSELELHLTYLSATEQDDLDTPYKNIVAIGRHAATLHHVRYDRGAPDRPDTSLLLDAGATCFGYASDITRTHVRGDGDDARAFAALVQGVDRVQRELCSLVAPGLSYETLHDRAHELLAPLLRELGLCRAPDDELVGAGVTRAFFPHGLGHSLGIQVHDVGLRRREPAARNPYLRNTADVAAGQVFTIEPGVYFIPALLEPLRAEPVGAAIDWRLVERLAPFGGVRIEDNLAVSEGGSVNLTRDNWGP